MNQFIKSGSIFHFTMMSKGTHDNFMNCISVYNLPLKYRNHPLTKIKSSWHYGIKINQEINIGLYVSKPEDIYDYSPQLL